MLKRFLATVAVATALVGGGLTANASAGSVAGSLSDSWSRPAGVSPHTVVKIDRFAPHSTYVIADYDSVSGGIRLFRSDLHGIQRCFGRTQAALYYNSRLVALTGVRTFSPGTRVTAHFDSHGTFLPIRTTITWAWRGSCAPAAGERATVTRA